MGCGLQVQRPETLVPVLGGLGLIPGSDWHGTLRRKEAGPIFWGEHVFFERHEMHAKAIADTPALERARVRGVFGVYVAPGHVRTAVPKKWLSEKMASQKGAFQKNAF